MYYIPYPLPDQLFYWSWDPEEKTVISKKEWAQSGIPELEFKTWVGSYWYNAEYSLVKSYLCNKNYDVNGKQCAQDRGHPELIWDDSHARRIMELKDTDSNEDLEGLDQHGGSEELEGKESCSSISQPAYPSTSLLMGQPAECTMPHTKERDSCYETNAKNFVKETFHMREQQTMLQETRRQPNTSKGATQRLTPSKHSPRLDHKVAFSTVDTVGGWDGTARVHLEERDSSTATYLAQFLEFDTDNIADASSQRDISVNSLGSTGQGQWDFLVVEDE
ncbi:hypothetical protein PM082_019785 [Marasmius tenuissimus]|nr:hypothetical protein PM082_019785 [Marasmius tenuissimus]